MPTLFIGYVLIFSKKTSVRKIYILCIRINKINPLFVIIILTLKILFSVGSQHFCVDYTRHKVSSPR